MQRVVVNLGTDREVWGEIFSEDEREITVLCHGGSRRKFSRRENEIKILPDEND